MPKDAVSKTVQRAVIGGFWYTRNPPDITGPSSPTLTQLPVPHVNSIDLVWVNGQDAQSGIASTYVEVSPSGMGVWSRRVLPWPASSDTIPGLTSATAYDIRLANVDASANANVSPYSAVVTVSTVGSAADLAPGTLALAVASVTVNEGGSISIGVTLSGPGAASPAVSVDWQFSGFNQGTPSPANGTLTWAGNGDTSTQFIQSTAGTVTSTQSGVLKLLNPAAASGNLIPTLGLASISVTVTNTVVAGIKWDPGDYAGSQNFTDATDSKLTQQVTEQNLVLSSGANVLGWAGYYYPACFQTVLGSFSFPQVVRDLNRLRSMSTPKRLIVTVLPNFYGSVNYTKVVPASVLNDSSFGASPVAGKYGWWSIQGNTGVSLAWWRPAVMDWVISLFQAMAATVNATTGLTLDADPYLEFTSFGECAFGADAGDATFSIPNLVTQYKRLITAINIAWPSTAHLCQNNISADTASAQDLTNYCYANRTIQSGPDTYVPGQKTQPLTGGQAAAIGVGMPGTGYTGPDLRGKIGMVSFTQGPEISLASRYKMFTPHTFHTQINNVLQQSHRIFTMVSTSATDDPIPAYPNDGPNTGANPGNWHSILQVINGSPLTHIAKPTNLQNVTPPPPAFTPTQLRTFNGLTNNVAPTGSQYGPFIGGNGYGSFGDTSRTRGGRSSSINVRIQAGTSGDNEAGSTTNGIFGHFFDLIPAAQAGLGEQLWLGMWINYPVGFNPLTTIEVLKWVRVVNDTTGQKTDLQLYHNNTTAQVGWRIGDENTGNGPQSDFRKTSNRLYVGGQWNWLELYMKPSNAYATQEYRWWINGLFAGEIIGTAEKWIDNTGVVQTATASPGFYQLPNSGSKISSFWFCTFWNPNYSPSDQSINIDSIAAYKGSPSGLPDADQFGNKMMGTNGVPNG